MKLGQIRGNWGQQFVASLLAECGCLIRNVPEGHDSGIDLYCETIEPLIGNKFLDYFPFLHFFVQVKTLSIFTRQRKAYPLTSLLGKRKKDIPKIIRYWQQQPVPLFIFGVPAEGEKKLIIFKTSDIEENSIHVRPSAVVTIDERDKSHVGRLIDFISSDNAWPGVKVETVIWNLLKGFLHPIPQVNKTTLNYYPVGVFSKPPESKLRAIIQGAMGTVINTLWRICEEQIMLLFDEINMRPKSTQALQNIKKLDPWFKALEELVSQGMPDSQLIPIAFWYKSRSLPKDAKRLIRRAIGNARKHLANAKRQYEIARYEPIKIKLLREVEKHEQHINDWNVYLGRLNKN